MKTYSWWQWDHCWQIHLQAVSSLATRACYDLSSKSVTIVSSGTITVLLQRTEVGIEWTMIDTRYLHFVAYKGDMYRCMDTVQDMASRYGNRPIRNRILYTLRTACNKISNVCKMLRDKFIIMWSEVLLPFSLTALETSAVRSPPTWNMLNYVNRSS